LVELLTEISSGRSCTPFQIALAYLISQGQVVAIPGAKSITPRESNAAASEIVLPAGELLALRRAADLVQISRSRASAQLVTGLLRRRQPEPSQSLGEEPTVTDPSVAVAPARP